MEVLINWMSPIMDIRIIVGIISLLTAFYTFMKFLDYRSREQKLESIGISFRKTVVHRPFE